MVAYKNLLQNNLALAVCLLLLIPGLWAQEIQVTSSAPSQVAVGERFRLSFQVNAQPSDFTPPAFSGFRVLSGPSQSSSSSMQIINGQTTRSVSFTYTYLLEATQEGSFTVGPARVAVDGNTYQSQSFSIQVSGTSAQAAPAQPRQGAEPSQASPDRAAARDLFIRASASKTNPFQGEQVIVTYNLYTRVTVNQYSIEKLPSYRGFWSENITSAGQPPVRTEVVDGETYRVAEIRRVALFPQRSGEIQIEPLEVEMVVSLPGQRRRQSLFDEFFGGSPFDQRTVRQTVRSNGITLNVKPLPVQNRPAAFTGMVGSEFEVTATVQPTQLRPNDAANLRITITGKGNLRMLENPNIAFPANLEVFDPNVTDNIRNTTAGITGSRSFEYLMIPRTGGEFVIPPFTFVYFDAQRQSYVSRSTPEFVLEVSGDPSQPGIAGSAPSQEEIRLLATDIRHIRTGNVNFVPAGKTFYGSPLFYMLLAVPLLLFLFFTVYWRSQIKLHGNQQLLRHKKAQKLARKRLKKAKLFADKKQENEFYDEIFRALWGYLSDKLSIPVSILNKETVSGAFKSQKVPQELSDSFLETLNQCEFARFAPGQKEDKMAEIYSKALQTIVTIEKDLRSKKN
ncbi:MAG: BatD family protein [Bacteroidales bacterium]